MNLSAPQVDREEDDRDKINETFCSDSSDHLSPAVDPEDTDSVSSDIGHDVSFEQSGKSLHETALLFQ